MIYCQELQKSFETKELLFSALKESKEVIIAEKRSKIFNSCEKGLSVYTNQNTIQKAIETVKSFEIDKDYYYFVVNSSRILDSHKDLHIDGNWEQTVKQQQGKVYLVWDHTLKRSEIIAMKEDIEMLTATIPFSMIGKSYEGDAYSLIYKVRKDKIINKEAKEWLEKGHELEASVRMQYVKIDLALNSNSKEDEKEKLTYDKYYPTVANKEEVGEVNYFWVISEAKNVMESSLVLFGSNPATGQLRDIEAVNDTSKNEPTEVTQKTNRRILI